MNSPKDDPLFGEIVDEHDALSVDELCRLCAVERSYICELVEEGVLTVRIETADWRFGGGAVRRVRRARRLQHDLEINLPGVALALELLEEIDELRRLQQFRRGAPRR